MQVGAHIAQLGHQADVGVEAAMAQLVEIVARPLVVGGGHAAQTIWWSGGLCDVGSAMIGGTIPLGGGTGLGGHWGGA